MKRAVVIMLFFVLLGGNAYSASPPAYRVVSSILPWGDFLKELCHGRCEVDILIPPGSTPHTWSPRPTSIKALHSARLFVYTDDCLEPWAKDFLAASGKDNDDFVLRVGDLISKRMCNKDPHLWLDFRFDQQVVKALVHRLKEIDPDGEAIYEKNASGLLAKLRQLDQSYQRALAHCKFKTIVVAGHNAFTRVADRYGLKSISVMGISPDAHVTPRGLTRVIEFLKKNGATAIFFDHAVTDKIARVISLETGAKVLELSPGVALTKEDLEQGTDFLTIMERNLQALSKGLVCTTTP